MLILVTRPEPQASEWALDLQAQGLQAASLPLMAMGPPADPLAVTQAWRQLAQQRCVMFVSPNAAHWFAKQRPDDAIWPAQTLLAAPGPGTAQTALTLFSPVGLGSSQVLSPPDQSAQFDSEHLWPILQGLDWSGQSVLVISGGEDGEVRGRRWLSEQWTQAGATVSALLTYERHPPQWSDAQQHLAHAAYRAPAQHAWLLSSSQAVQHLSALMGPPPPGATALCTHPKVADTARLAGFDRVVDTRPQAADVAQACLALSDR